MNSELVQEIKNMAQAAAQSIHTAVPGIILSYDSAKGQAVVKPYMKFTTKGGNPIDYPQISGVPVLFQQYMGQQATVAFPVNPGDGCLLIISEQSLDYWMYGQDTGTDLRFDLTNAVAIPGLFAPANAVVADACKQDAIVADVSGTRITVKAGKIQIDAAEIILNGNVAVKGSISASGDVVSENKISGAHHTHHGDSGGQTSQPQ